MQDQVRLLESERDQIERSIKTLSQDPFINREKNGVSVFKRITDLEEKLVDREKQFRVLED